MDEVQADRFYEFVEAAATKALKNAKHNRYFLQCLSFEAVVEATNQTMGEAAFQDLPSFFKEETVAFETFCHRTVFIAVLLTYSNLALSSSIVNKLVSKHCSPLPDELCSKYAQLFHSSGPYEDWKNECKIYKAYELQFAACIKKLECEALGQKHSRKKSSVYISLKAVRDIFVEHELPFRTSGAMETFKGKFATLPEKLTKTELVLFESFGSPAFRLGLQEKEKVVVVDKVVKFLLDQQQNPLERISRVVASAPELAQAAANLSAIVRQCRHSLENEVSVYTLIGVTSAQGVLKEGSQHQKEVQERLKSFLPWQSGLHFTSTLKPHEVATALVKSPKFSKERVVLYFSIYPQEIPNKVGVRRVGFHTADNAELSYTFEGDEMPKRKKPFLKQADSGYDKVMKTATLLTFQAGEQTSTTLFDLLSKKRFTACYDLLDYNRLKWVARACGLGGDPMSAMGDLETFVPCKSIAGTQNENTFVPKFERLLKQFSPEPGRAWIEVDAVELSNLAMDYMKKVDEENESDSEDDEEDPKYYPPLAVSIAGVPIWLCNPRDFIYRTGTYVLCSLPVACAMLSASDRLQAMCDDILSCVSEPSEGPPPAGTVVLSSTQHKVVPGKAPPQPKVVYFSLDKMEQIIKRLRPVSMTRRFKFCIEETYDGLRQLSLEGMLPDRKNMFELKADQAVRNLLEDLEDEDFRKCVELYEDLKHLGGLHGKRSENGTSFLDRLKLAGTILDSNKKMKTYYPAELFATLAGKSLSDLKISSSVLSDRILTFMLLRVVHPVFDLADYRSFSIDLFARDLQEYTPKNPKHFENGFHFLELGKYRICPAFIDFGWGSFQLDCNNPKRFFISDIAANALFIDSDFCNWAKVMLGLSCAKRQLYCFDAAPLILVAQRDRVIQGMFEPDWSLLQERPPGETWETRLIPDFEDLRDTVLRLGNVDDDDHMRKIAVEKAVLRLQVAMFEASFAYSIRCSKKYTDNAIREAQVSMRDMIKERDSTNVSNATGILRKVLEISSRSTRLLKENIDVHRVLAGGEAKSVNQKSFSTWNKAVADLEKEKAALEKSFRFDSDLRDESMKRLNEELSRLQVQDEIEIDDTAEESGDREELQQRKKGRATPSEPSFSGADSALTRRVAELEHDLKKLVKRTEQLYLQLEEQKALHEKKERLWKKEVQVLILEREKARAENMFKAQDTFAGEWTRNSNKTIRVIADATKQAESEIKAWHQQKLTK